MMSEAHEPYVVKSYREDRALTPHQQEEQLQAYLNEQYKQGYELVQVIYKPGPYMTVVLRKFIVSIPSI